MLTRLRWRAAAAIAVAVLWAAAGVVAPARAQEVQFPKGLRIGLVPPQGLTPADGFVGFGDPERKVAIAITELPPQAYYAVEHDLFRADHDPGIVIESRQLFGFAGGVGFLVTGHQQVEGETYHRWLLLAGEPDFTALIQVQLPESARAVYPDTAIKAALSGVTFRPTPLEEQLSMLPFHLGELAGFRVERVVGEGVVVLTDSDSQVVDRPRLMIMVGRGAPEEQSEQSNFAQQLLAAMPGLADVRLTDSEPLRIGGRPGYEVRARGRDPYTGGQLHLIQWLRFGGGGYLRVVAAATEEAWPQAYPRFRAVRDGIDLR